MSARIFGTAALVAVLAQAANVNVHNNCNFHVQLTPSHGGADQSPEVVQPGDHYSAPADGDSWCLKLYAADGQGFSKNPTQLEWSTWQSGGHTVLSYDLSDIDMGDSTSFLQHGMNLTSEDPSCDSKSANCRPAICHPQGPGADKPCTDAYNQPYDTRTLGASAQYDINMHLCTESDQAGGLSQRSADASAEAEAAPAPQTTLATVAAPAPTSNDDDDAVINQLVARRDELTTTIEKIKHMHHARHNNWA